MLKMEQTALMQADEKTQITAMEFAQSDIKNLPYGIMNVAKKMEIAICDLKF